MRAVIVEDEKWTADRLKSLIEKNFPEIKIEAVLSSVAISYSWFMDNEHPDVVFMDIELGDGTSFDLMDILKIKSSLIFTTAYNQHAIKAFRYNSVDYLLKPIEEEELIRAVNKMRSMKLKQDNDDLLIELRRQLNKSYKERFLVKTGDKFKTINTSEIAYIYSEDSYTQIVDKESQKYFIDYSLEDLDEIMDPGAFFRLNRKVISSIGAIDQIASYFNGRLIVSLIPEFNDQIVISREKVKPFKEWLDK